MKQGFNPILPLDEYIPDGEPHVFGDRIYLFGSHDLEGAARYCAGQNYVGWSAPLSNPIDWRYEGEIYNSNQDPDYVEGVTNDMYAPDVVRGNDGRYYLYYNVVSASSSASGHNSGLKVAVCDTPAGQYEYLGFIKNPDGSMHNEYLMGDPAVLNDDGVIRMYYGWSLSTVAAEAHAQGKGYEGQENQEYAKRSAEEGADSHDVPKMELPEAGDPRMNEILTPLYEMLFHKSAEDVKDLKYPLMGANVIELADDMMTVIGEPKRIVPGQFDTKKDSSFFGHAFYEAASMRKIDGTYYFIYSSENSNELCYATSRYPDKDFVYGGTIISNGDVGYKGLKKENSHNMTANNHGSIECINDQWYIFYHRHTHRTTFSRQACVEKIEIKSDGSIDQVECTSMGFNHGPLMPKGEFPGPTSCILTNGRMPHCTNTMLDMDIPYIAHGNNEKNVERFITNIKEGTKIGYKYFAFTGEVKLTLRTRGEGCGKFEIHTDKGLVGEVKVSASKDWKDSSTQVFIEDIEALYFIYQGSKYKELLSFFLE